MSSVGPAEPSGSAGRYVRSASGMVAAMVVLVVVVGAFVGFRGLVRENPESPVRAVDYAAVLGTVEGQTGWRPVAPSSLPDGWVATSVNWEAAPAAAWHLGMLTDDESYVGLEEVEVSTERAAELFVDEDVRREGSVALDGLGGEGTWERWRGVDGDVALAREVSGRTVLVVTSGDLTDLTTLIQTLR